MTDLADSSRRPAIPRANRRITALILSFALISGLTSVLPLLPEIEKLIPIGLMRREAALTLYAGALLVFTALFMPLFVIEEEERATFGAWWWLGGLIFLFAAVPLYTLAYIAGVHRDAVIEILAWAGVLHGAALIALRLIGVGRAGLVVALGFALLVALPAADGFAELLSLRPSRFAWMPSARVLALTRDHAVPRPGAALVALLAVHLVLLALTRPRPGTGGRAPSRALTLLAGTALAGAILGAAGPGAAATATATANGAGAPTWIAPALDRWVSGRAFPLRVQVEAGTTVLEMKVGDRERWIWRPEGGRRRIWLHPRLAREGERIELRADGGAPTVLAPERLEDDRVLVLALGEDLRGALAAAEAAAPGVTLRTWEEERWPAEAAFLDPFSGLVLDARGEAALDAAGRATLEDFAARGGRVIVLGAARDATRRIGEGEIRHESAAELASFGRLLSRRAPVADADLYDRFALPDWGRVELGALVAFLVVFHLVFLLIFLLPLRYDARKRLSVYLVSVGFVLVLVVAASYFALTRRLLPKTQVLQQDLVAAVLESEAGAGRLDIEELVCFASFNEAPARIEVADRRGVSPVYREAGLGVGRVELSGTASGMVFPALPLDRFARKQVLSFRDAEAAPLRLEAGSAPGSWRLRPVPEAPDRLGLRSARRRFAFARIDGRLHRVLIEGETLRVAERPLARAWSEVAEGVEDPVETRAFLRSILARSVARDRDLLVLGLEGLPLRHRGESYLARREILQTLLIPLP